MTPKDNEELSWSGFSSNEYHSQSGRIPELSHCDPRFEVLPLFAPVLQHLKHRPIAEIQRLQQEWHGLGNLLKARRKKTQCFFRGVGKTSLAGDGSQLQEG